MSDKPDMVAVPRNLLQAAVALFAPTNPIVPEHRVVRELREYAKAAPLNDQQRGKP